MTHGLPHTRVQESAEVAIHRWPRQERGRRRYVPLLAAGAQHVKQANYGLVPAIFVRRSLGLMA